MSISMEGYEVSFHLPNSLDLMTIATCSDTDQARRQLLDQCIQSVIRTSENDEPEKLDSDLQLVLRERLIIFGQHRVHVRVLFW